MTRALIVAASPQSRSRLQNLLESREIEVVARVADVASLTDYLLDGQAEVLIVEIAESGTQSFEAVLDTFSGPDIFAEMATILIVDSAPGRPLPWISEALRLGVRAVLPGDASDEQVVTAIEAANAGLVILHPEQLNEVFLAPSSTSRPLPELTEPLTRREREVLQMLAGGLANKEIASRLTISEHTAKFHVASILGKLSAGSRTEAVAVGIRYGLVLL